MASPCVAAVAIQFGVMEVRTLAAHPQVLKAYQAVIMN